MIKAMNECLGSTVNGISSPLAQKADENELAIPRQKEWDRREWNMPSFSVLSYSIIGPVLEYIEKMNRDYFENEKSLHRTFKNTKTEG